MNKNKKAGKPLPITDEKLQKILARTGLGSRRQMEEWIQMGRVKVNGQLAQLGLRVSENDKIQVDEKFITWKAADAFKTRILIFYKPEGVICTRSDPQGRPTVFEQLPKIARGRWISIGRLDINTLGLLLLTNNGELAHRLMHPSFQIEREYAVRVFGEVQKEIIERLQTGIELDDGEAHFETIQDAGGSGMNHWYHVTLKEGRCRLVRRLWESQNIPVSRLLRVRYGNIALPRSLRAGRWEELEQPEIERLQALVFPELNFKKEVKRRPRKDFRSPRKPSQSTSSSRKSSQSNSPAQPRRSKIGSYKNTSSR